MFDVCVIGCGRVGLPLALALKKNGLNVVGCDTNLRTADLINNNIMPFEEPGFQELMVNGGGIGVHYNISDAKAYIITVGTPLMQHIETDLSYIKSVIDVLIENNRIGGRLIILRSTVAPGSTQRIADYIRQKTHMHAGKDFFLAMCPERIVEGNSFVELYRLPQIIGAEDLQSRKLAAKIFIGFGVDILYCNFIEAELSKLLCNIYRYINFAIPNYFTYLTNRFGADVYKVFNIMNHKYPRNDGLKKPGFAAGTCLRKDFGMISETMPHSDLLVQAYKVNEFMPKFYVDLVEHEIWGAKVGVLGYTMKANTDDTRDSLVPKLIRYIDRLSPKEIMIAEPNFDKTFGFFDDEDNNYKFWNFTCKEVVESCDVIFIAMNHDEFGDLHCSDFKETAVIVDIWNVLKTNQLIIHRGKK